MHFSAFFPMMEVAEHEMLRNLGMSVIGYQIDDAEPISWPRVSANCDYLSAARFEDVLVIQVSVAKIGTSSVQYQFSFSRENTPIARGLMTAVCCRMVENGLKKTPIPDSIRSLLARYQ